MSYSISEVTATGGNTFNIPFDYIAQSEIAVFVDGVSTSFTFTSANVIDITPAPTSGALVRIKRTTSLTDRTVDFQSGAVLTEEDLDNSNIQVFHAAQEAIDAASESISVGLDGKFDAQLDSVNRAIKNVADPTDAQDVVTKNWAETGMSSQLATATAKASEASTSASSASASETAAASSASTASTKASEASVSAANAAQSSVSAATSATNAATSATNASTSESNASSDATTASNAASTATSQASVASSAATTATSQATSATNSANAAASSESNASTSATNAATSATSASTSASQAQGYRDTTLGYKNSAATSATGALSSKNAAATSETNAAASESSAATDASTATTKASEAATSASNAATSATNAASSASAAAQSAIDAADAADFDPADYAQTTNNLSDLANASSALTNLGIANHNNITVDGSGNVSLASDNPQVELHDTGTGGTIWRIANGPDGNGKLTFNDNDDERVTFTNNGNVGIGTSSPVAKFDLRGNASIGPANTTDAFQGLSFVQGKDSSVANATNYIDFKNNLSTPDAHILADHITDGSSAIIFGTTSSGSRSTDRRQECMRVTTSGISVTGNIAVTGTVDGRDVAADGAKLDGIEAGATADQTKADIDALGIDADTVDGVHASSFALKSGPELEKYITFNDYDDGSAANTGLRTYVRDGTWYVNNDVSASNTINISLGGHKVWHAGNDGSGSGLDADTLDNLNSTAFGRLYTAADWSRTQSYNRVTLTDAATINWNMATSPSAIVSLSANRTMGNPTNIKAGNWYTLRVYHSGAPRTLAWGSRWKFGGNGAPELSTLANDYDVLTFYALSTTALSFVGIAKNIGAA